MKEKRKKESVISSTLAKIIAFFVLAISFAVGLAGLIGTLYLWEADAFRGGSTEVIHNRMKTMIWEDVPYITAYYQQGDTEQIETYLSTRNLSVEIFRGDNFRNPSWSNYDGAPTAYSFTCYTDDDFPLTLRLYVDDTFPLEDEYKQVYELYRRIDDYLYVVPAAAVLGIFLFLCCFIFLMCGAGHHRGKEGITGGVLYNFHFDIVTLVFVVVAVLGVIVLANNLSWRSNFGTILMVVGVATLEVIWGTLYCTELAVQLKLGTLLKSTLIYRILRAVGRGAAALIRGLPLVVNMLLWYGGFCIAELIVCLFFCSRWNNGEFLIPWVLEKIVCLPIVLYFALVCRKLQMGSRALAEGDLDYKLDTSRMILDFKEHGENLNRIGEGMSLAVEERIRSEHLKTELITNVSHDLKTPLTSIINYADLIGAAVSGKSGGTGGDPEKIFAEDADAPDTEPQGVRMREGSPDDAGEIDRAELAEYAEVLLRQSKRLKKLLDDLLEASKATTGNLEVNLVPCEIGVLLAQTVGEYEQRFAQRGLELIVRQPEEAVRIRADGRHLWRVFDNLMNNICKYAQENTRVYLTVERKEEETEIIFRNMSKYPLEGAAEELKERFVRGDKSRHMEGNGLGLSIAAGLVELQKGRMEIVTDGDLFKVVLHFPIWKD